MSGLKQARREDYRYRIEIPTRWADADAYGHVNNVIYYSWFDTAVTRMMYERGVLSLHGPGAIGLCVESHCEYFAPVEFPQTIEAFVRIGRLGDKSLRYEVALFLPGDETPAAAGHFVHVFVDRATRKPTPLTLENKAALADLVVAAA
ncbi:MAG: acyl-CoA thioesterase [Caulobacterales bacterium]|jgi:acyl-CoA thioester hydrolase|nr:acyl-CoA thioesterase [Caulobacterales bacterium]